MSVLAMHLRAKATLNHLKNHPKRYRHADSEPHSAIASPQVQCNGSSIIRSRCRRSSSSPSTSGSTRRRRAGSGAGGLWSTCVTLLNGTSVLHPTGHREARGLAIQIVRMGLHAVVSPSGADEGGESGVVVGDVGFAAVGAGACVRQGFLVGGSLVSRRCSTVAEVLDSVGVPKF